GERTANNSTSTIERGRALSGAEPRVFNQMSDNDNRQSATEVETHSDIPDIQVQPSSPEISDEKSASITPLPAAITTNSSVTVYSSVIPQRQQQTRSPAIQAFPPAFTTPPATPSAPMAAELVSNSESDENTMTGFAEKEDVLNMSDETNDISNRTGITNRSISPFDSLRQDQLDDLGFYTELPTISPPAYTPTAPPICNLPYGPIPGYDRHRLQDM
ncbi:2421_t:CDS:1, partial [Paraglomus occultum]